MRKTFTRDQVENLLNNENVVRCSEHAITYSHAFKIQAVRQYGKGLGSREIFENAGFDLDIIGKKKPKWLLRDWNAIYRQKGAAGLQREGRGSHGGRPRTRGLTNTEKIERLEAEVAYLKAENDFLAKLRVKRAE